MPRTAPALTFRNRLRPRRPAGQPASARQPVRVDDFGPNPGHLTMQLYLPDALPVGAPLVVVLHGCTQTASGYAAGAGWLTLADRFGFAVLCPEQTRANNPNLCFNWFQRGDTTRDAGEAASIHAMVQWTLDEYGLDRKRVFISGLSAGGAMTAVMLATYPEVFAAGAVIAGLAYGSANSIPEAFGAMMQAPTRSGSVWGDKVRDAASHSGSWPTISIWHGTTDATVRPAAGEELLRQWLDVHDLHEGPETAMTADGRPYEVWKTPEGQPVIEMHRIPGMAHGTPLQTEGADGNGVAGAFLLDVGISSSLEIARTWGIAPAGQKRPATKSGGARPDHARPGPGRSPGFAAPRATGGPPNPVTTVIEAALRTAGLMR